MRQFVALALLAAALLVAGCGSSSHSTSSFGAFTILPSSLPDGTQNQAYSVTFTATGGHAPYGHWRISLGALPTGVSLDATTGTLSGTPTGVGTATFSVQATDHLGLLAARGYTLVVLAPITVGPASGALPSASVADPYSVTFTASLGTAPYTFSLASGSLPAGLTLDAVTGVLSGTPTTATAAQAFSISATDHNSRVGTSDYTLTVILQPGVLFVSNLALASDNANVGTTDAAGLAIWRYDAASTVSGTAVTPTATIQGSNTGLIMASSNVAYNDSVGIWFEPARDLLWVPASADGNTGVYAFEDALLAGGTTTTTANVAPSTIYQFSGANTTLVNPCGVAVDSQRNIVYVADDNNSTSGALLLFPLSDTANGDVTPTAIVTSILNPEDVFCDAANDRIYVVAGNAGSPVNVAIIDSASTLTTTTTTARVTRSITNSVLQTDWLTQIVVDTTRDVMYIGNAQAPSVFVYDHASTVSTTAAPDRTISATTVPGWTTYTGIHHTTNFAMAIDPLRDEIYLTDPQSAQVLVFSSASTLDDSLLATPVRSIQSASFSADSNDPPSVLFFDPLH